MRAVVTAARVRRSRGLGQGHQPAVNNDIPLARLLTAWQAETRDALGALRHPPHPEGVLPSSGADQASAAMRRLRWMLMPRETLKQRFLWPAIRANLGDGADVVEQLRARKHDFEREMIRLRWADERSLRFDRQIDALIERVGDYVDREAAVVPRLATEIPVAAQKQLVRELTMRRPPLPVQAHPDLPRGPWAATVLGHVAGVVDRFRDRFTTAPG